MPSGARCLDGQGKRAVIAGVTSSIGQALAHRLSSTGWTVDGTSRSVAGKSFGVRRIVQCDFENTSSVSAAANQLMGPWDLLVLAPGSLEPVAPFIESSMDAWQTNITINLVSPLRFVHEMLLGYQPVADANATCLFFAGGGVNSAPEAVSAYTVGKIGLIKATELLDNEIANVKFATLGPGWVRAPIHQQVLNSTTAPRELVQETERRLEQDDFVPMDVVLSAIAWIIESPKRAVGGRNFSATGDAFGDPELHQFLIHNPAAYKLRRHYNNRSMEHDA